MRDLVILAILSGWLITELKDYFINSGISNTLAFSLLMIIFIIAIILVIAAMTTSYGIFRTVRNLTTLLELPSLITQSLDCLKIYQIAIIIEKIFLK